MVRAVVTVMGSDRPGIIAAVTSEVASMNINVLDITQTIMQDKLFVMCAQVDLNQCEVGFHVVKERLEQLGEKLGLSIRIQRAEVFDAMHRI